MANTARGSAGKSGDQQAQARDFVERYTTGDPTEGYSEAEAQQLAAQVLPQLSQDQFRQALQASAANMQTNMKESDRSALNKMLQQRQQGEGMVDITRTGDVVPSGQSGGGGGGAAQPGLDDILGGLLGGGGGSGIGDILGGLLGGGSQAGSASPSLDDVLSGMVGTDQSQTPQSQSQAEPEGGGIGGMLSDVMSSPMGKTLMAGAAAFAMKELFDKG